ncbi:hypothetical protein HYV11_03400 [Candidatus Dependentiae bacterium]|nr:hypothetical protein [Candidatus Dependentiae bacterium]
MEAILEQEYNSALREQERLYQQSKVLLSDYLKYLKEAENMKKLRPDLAVQLDPQTARPFYLKLDDTRVHYPHDGLATEVYSGEIAIPHWHIAKEKLTPVQDSSFEQWGKIKPVENVPTNK